MESACLITLTMTNHISGGNSKNRPRLPDPEPGYNPAWDERFSGIWKTLGDDNPAEWPKLSIITPSFNQGQFIERTIRCILLQEYPNLEYIVADGGSTDETLRVIEKYSSWIDDWHSEPDTGMYDALNKGFARSSGEIMAWSPTGDVYEPGALRVLGQVFRQMPEIEWLTSLHKVKCNESGEESSRYEVDGFSRRALRKGLNFVGGNPYASFTIAQQSTFWRRGLWERSGGRLDDTMRGAGDFELWMRFSRHAEIYALDRALGVFMNHEGQESVKNAVRMHSERETAFSRHEGSHLGALEGWLRRRVLRRRPFSLLKRISPFGFRCQRVHWDDDRASATISTKRFV